MIPPPTPDHHHHHVGRWDNAIRFQAIECGQKRYTSLPDLLFKFSFSLIILDGWPVKNDIVENPILLKDVGRYWNHLIEEPRAWWNLFFYLGRAGINNCCAKPQRSLVIYFGRMLSYSSWAKVKKERKKKARLEI